MVAKFKYDHYKQVMFPYIEVYQTTPKSVWNHFLSPPESLFTKKFRKCSIFDKTSQEK